MDERCTVCQTRLHRNGEYGTATVAGRSHASSHHFVATRFFSKVFSVCPWASRGKKILSCYECHEKLLHNPVLLEQDLAMFAELVRQRGFSEDEKPEDYAKIAGRIMLLHEVIRRGLKATLGDAQTD